MLERGIIVKDTRATTLRLAPPLVIDQLDLDTALDTILGVLAEVI